ncbi:MAG: extracellular solute-binding protein [Defluviitaleaceae bacterium]|nr:extracellular solute-binding protein [Defluviitaleaceae bacterium]
MKRGLLALALLMSMVLILAACNRGGEEQAADPTPEPTPQAEATTTPDVDEPEVEESDVPFYLTPMADRLVINVGASFGTPEGAVPPGTTPETNTFNELVRDHLNVEFSYMWMVPSAQGEERFQLALATGDVPDIMQLGRRDFAELSSFGMLRDLRPAFDEFVSPGIRGLFEYFNDGPLELATRDGQLLGIPLPTDSHQQIQLVWYRHDWLEALDLSVPTTMEELIDLAVAFVENDMSGQGNTTGIGLQQTLVTTWMPDARGIFHGHGAFPTAWINRGGELIPGTIQPETRDALNTLRNMYSVGAIHQEFATMNMDQLTAEIVGDRVGIVLGEWWLPNWPMNSNLENNPDADWRATTLVAPAGAPAPHAVISRNNVVRYTVVSANAPAGTEEALMKILNLHWEIMYSLDAEERFGDRIHPENGFVYNWAPAYLNMAGFEQYLNYVMVNEAILSGDTSAFFTSDQRDLFYAHTIVNEGHVSETMPFHQAWGLYTSRVAHHGGWGMTMQVRDSGRILFNEFYGDPTPTEMAVASILSDMWAEFSARYIMGAIDYDAWYTFVEDWLRLGGEAWTAEVNEQFSAMQ